MKRLVVASTAMVLLSSATPAAATAGVAAEPAFVRLVNAQPGTSSIDIEVDGEPHTVDFAQATDFMLVAAQVVRISSSEAADRVAFDAGDTYEVVYGGGAEPRFVVHHLDDARVPDGTAGVRVLNGIADLPTLEVACGGATVDVGRLDAAGYSVLSPGTTRCTAGTGPTNVFLDETLVLSADTKYTVLVTGGGEQPPRMTLIEDARQSPTSVPPSTPIETGDRNMPASSPWWIVVAGVVGCVVLAVALLARSRRRRRILAAALAAIVLGGACTAAPMGSENPPGASQVSSTTPGTTGSTSATPASPGATPEVSARLDHLFVPAIAVDSQVVEVLMADLPALFETRNGQPVLAKGVAGYVPALSISDQSMVTIVGHNTSHPNDPAVFEQLPVVDTGDAIVISPSPLEAPFTVVDSFEAPKGQLPAELWSPVPSGLARIVLITCSGGRDARGLRTHNRVVVGYRIDG